MIRDVINGFENFVSNVQMLMGFIGESLYWIPISVDEIKKIIGIVIFVGILLTIMDWLYIQGNEMGKVSIASAYWGAILAFGSSVIGLSLIYSCFGVISEKDLSYMLPSTLGVAGFLALEVGVISFFCPEVFVLGTFAFFAAIPLWFIISLGALLIYLFKQGDVMQSLVILLLLSIPSAIFFGEEELVVIIIKK